MFYQEAGGVVEQAAETTAEVSLQEGRVFWRDGLRVVGHQVAADLCRALLTCGILFLLAQSHLVQFQFESFRGQ